MPRKSGAAVVPHDEIERVLRMALELRVRATLGHVVMDSYEYSRCPSEDCALHDIIADSLLEVPQYTRERHRD
ncbi:MAG: hypothetical protein JWR13_4054 [Mycobacterium sp.]|jgi:hypothetical protein|nr:hypothetical protein [Mycobacterium sp.]